MPLLVIKIHGLVQGVNFRYHGWRQAKELGIKGFIRNELDGAVYCEAQGEEEALRRFLEWCRTGPPMARVVNVEFSYVSEAKKYDDFNIEY